MTRPVTAIALVAAICTGCGTVTNLGVPKTMLTPSDPQQKVYGGVSNSIALFGLAVADHQGSGPNFTAGLFALDVALSAIGDTLTLPVTLPITVLRSIDRAFTDGFNDCYFPKDRPPTEPHPPSSSGEPPGHLTPERVHGGIL